MASPPPGYDHKGGPYTQQPQPQGYYSSGDPQQGYYPQGQPQQGYYPPPQQQGFAPVQQVQPGMAMPMTQMSAGVPPGLEYLASLSSVKISQVLHIEESRCKMKVVWLPDIATAGGWVCPSCIPRVIFFLLLDTA